jgi:uncharacterized integral membrane protein
MARLIVSIVILVVLAVLLIFNGTFMTPVSLFGYRIERVPVVVVAIVSWPSDAVRRSRARTAR